MVGKLKNFVFLQQEKMNADHCDSVVQSVVGKIIKRAEFGKKKYGKDMDRQDLTPLDWLIHAEEEAMDLLLYIERFKKDLIYVQSQLDKSGLDIKLL